MLTSCSSVPLSSHSHVGLQIYLKLIEKEADIRRSPRTLFEYGYGDGENVMHMFHPPEALLDSIMYEYLEEHKGCRKKLPSEIKEAYFLYLEKVGSKLAAAFQNSNSVKKPHMETLVEVANVCGLKGTSNDVLSALAPHIIRESFNAPNRVPTPERGGGPRNTYIKALDEKIRKDKSLRKLLKDASEILLQPSDLIKKRFEKARAASMLPSPVAVAAPSSAAATTLTALVPSGPPPPVDEYLGRYIRPRTDCDKCAVARGPDPSVRSQFASEGGKGRSRNISLKRGCPLAAHAISTTGDGVPLLEQYERDYGVKLTNKKQKFCAFMQSEYKVEPLGQAPSYKVTLYTPPRIDASLALEGGDIKLRLTAFGYEATSNQGTKDNFMGFQAVYARA